MVSATYAPSIDQGAKLLFAENFEKLIQQTNSKLVTTGVATMVNPDGKTYNMARMGKVELVEVAARNPDKQIVDYAIDNRMMSKKRFTRTVQIDAKHDINELLADPTSDLLAQLNAAKERVIDRVLYAAAIGPVLVGAPDAAPTSITAAADGVLTVDMTAGVTYAKINELTENFNNNELDFDMLVGSLICVTGKESTALMNEDKFINNDYLNNTNVADGRVRKAGMYDIVRFAGSKTGGPAVDSPIIPEGTTTRTCAVLTPRCLKVAMKVAKMEVEKSATKVNSYDLTVDFWIEAMRTEGAKVQLFTTTI